MNPWELIKAIYQKTHLRELMTIDPGICITLNKWLGYDPKQAGLVRSLIPYTFYISPLHYYYLLFFCVPRHYQVPFLHRPKKAAEEKPNKLLLKMQYVLNWTDREIAASRDVLDKVILDNSDYWKKELAVK